MTQISPPRVRIFLNLNKGTRADPWWSVQMLTGGRWRSVGYAKGGSVENATLFARESTRLRCAAARVREVHAWIEGDLTGLVGCVEVAKWSTPEISAALQGAAVEAIADLPRGITYRPFDEPGFRDRATGEIVTHAARAVCTLKCSIE